jgi:hypothetical protein
MQARINKAVIMALDVFKKIDGFVKEGEANQARQY